MNEVVGVVPAKGTSSRVPRKNWETINGLPLFLNAAYHLSRVLPRELVFVDSEDPEILALAAEHGFATLSRPDELATNQTSGIDLMRWEISMLASAGVIVQHFPTMPFLRELTLRRALNSVVSEGFDSAFLIHDSKEYTWSNGKPDYDLSVLPNSVELPTSRREVMGLYVTATASFRTFQNRICGKQREIQSSKIEAIDVDTYEDLAIARALAASHPESSECLGTVPSRSSPGPALIFLDVDGTQTNGRIYVSSSGLSRSYNVIDGAAIKRAAVSTPVFFLTAAGEDKSISQRAEMLGVSGVFYSCSNKLKTAADYCRTVGVDLDRLLYMGDDVADLELLRQAGFAYTPADSAIPPAEPAVQVPFSGGSGAVAWALEHSGALS